MISGSRTERAGAGGKSFDCLNNPVSSSTLSAGYDNQRQMVSNRHFRSGFKDQMQADSGPSKSKPFS